MLWSFWAAIFRAVWRRVAPRRLITYFGIWSRIDRQARRTYATLLIRSALGMEARNGLAVKEIPLGNARSFLFVCFGNLMRSPMAEAMLKRVLAERGIDGIVVRSAGLHAVAGREPHPWALAISRELGIPLDGHRAQALTPELVSSSDVVFAMDFENLVELQSLYRDANSKIFMLSRYSEGRQRNREIPDPYFGDMETTRRCYSEIARCIDNLVHEIEFALHAKGSLSPSR
jgi:protein-tyrosine phosphatase